MNNGSHEKMKPTVGHFAFEVMKIFKFLWRYQWINKSPSLLSDNVDLFTFLASCTVKVQNVYINVAFQSVKDWKETGLNWKWLKTGLCKRSICVMWIAPEGRHMINDTLTIYWEFGLVLERLEVYVIWTHGEGNQWIVLALKVELHWGLLPVLHSDSSSTTDCSGWTLGRHWFFIGGGGSVHPLPTKAS